MKWRKLRNVDDIYAYFINTSDSNVFGKLPITKGVNKMEILTNVPPILKRFI